MKKKVLGLVLALCLMVPFAFMLSACGDTAIYAGTNMTLAEAITQVDEGGVIKLDADIVLSAEVRIAKKVTIDLNGHKISNTTDLWSDPDTTEENSEDVWSLISVRANGDLTIKNGTMHAKEGDCYAIDVRYGGKVTIEDGEYIGNISAVYVVEGEVIVNGGKFNIQQEYTGANPYALTLNVKDANAVAETGTIVVNGGQFANYNPTEFLATGLTTEAGNADQNGDVWYTVVTDAE